MATLREHINWNPLPPSTSTRCPSWCFTMDIIICQYHRHCPTSDTTGLRLTSQKRSIMCWMVNRVGLMVLQFCLLSANCGDAPIWLVHCITWTPPSSSWATTVTWSCKSVCIIAAAVVRQFSSIGHSHRAKQCQRKGELLCNSHREPWTVYNHMDAVIMYHGWDPDPPNILECVKVTFFALDL